MNRSNWINESSISKVLQYVHWKYVISFILSLSILIVILIALQEQLSEHEMTGYVIFGYPFLALIFIYWSAETQRKDLRIRKMLEEQGLFPEYHKACRELGELNARAEILDNAYQVLKGLERLESDNLPYVSIVELNSALSQIRKTQDAIVDQLGKFWQLPWKFKDALSSNKEYLPW